MRIEVYRSATQTAASFDRFNEICRSCAAQEVKEGHHVEYDLYLSERSGSITEEDICENCEESFVTDTEIVEKIESVIY